MKALLRVKIKSLVANGNRSGISVAFEELSSEFIPSGTRPYHTHATMLTRTLLSGPPKSASNETHQAMHESKVASARQPESGSRKELGPSRCGHRPPTSVRAVATRLNSLTWLGQALLGFSLAKPPNVTSWVNHARLVLVSGMRDNMPQSII